jgi:AraC-like DNA-binding protein
VTPVGEPTISVSYIAPFLEAAGSDPALLENLARAGISPGDVCHPELRIPCRVAFELLKDAVLDHSQPLLGLKAGLKLKSWLLDVSLLAARSSATLRDGIACGLRFLELSDQSLEAQLSEDVESAVWRCWRASEFMFPALNDFTLASTYQLMRTGIARQLELLEVHFAHDQATDLDAYVQLFGRATFKFGVSSNALLFRSTFLNDPLLRAQPLMHTAYVERSNTLLNRLRGPDTMVGRVRQVTVTQLRMGDASMTSVAQALGVSVATLRRYLQREGNSFNDIFDDVRRDLAEEYLLKRNLPIAEVSRSLGFSHVAAFYRAFRRWFDGLTPTELRARMTTPGRATDDTHTHSQVFEHESGADEREVAGAARKSCS